MGASPIKSLTLVRLVVGVCPPLGVGNANTILRAPFSVSLRELRSSAMRVALARRLGSSLRCPFRVSAFNLSMGRNPTSGPSGFTALLLGFSSLGRCWCGDGIFSTRRCNSAGGIPPTRRYRITTSLWEYHSLGVDIQSIAG